ncbi:MAG: putative cytochrome [Herminiimonas sp.]|nr:putative cytochrome [Herminiimonas sp.]
MNENGMNPRAAKTGWHYGGPAIFLHWVLAVLIAGLVGLGWYMMSIEREPNSGWYFDLHKSFGLLVFALVVLRVLWRLNHKPAELPASLPKWQVKVSSITHWLLYACMILMPVTGFLGASYSKSGVVFFGLHVPAWLVPARDMAKQFFSIHSAIVWVLVALVVLHAAAGLKHLLIDKNDVFQRMWF